jgi:hypothetical protein
MIATHYSSRSKKLPIEEYLRTRCRMALEQLVDGELQGNFAFIFSQKGCTEFNLRNCLVKCMAERVVACAVKLC